MIPNKFVILWDNRPVGVDQGSGGYPYKTEIPCQIRYWDTRKEADDYRKIFEHSPSYGFHIPRVEIAEIQFRIVG
jgi:hypothetical protein